MKIRVSTDFGNSTTKQSVNGERIVSPSVIKRVFEIPSVTETDIEKLVANLYEELTVSITSASLERSGIFSVGHRATLDAIKSENMNITLGNKAEHDIPVIMNLSLTAASLVKAHFKRYKKLPKKIEAEGTLVGSIPASEYTSTIAENFEKRFAGEIEKEVVHVVLVHVGSHTVTVTIQYTEAKITEEGVPALYAFLEAEEDILENFRLLYQEDPKLASMTQRDFIALNGLGVDIGSGTTEYIHTHGINPVLDSCTGEKRGVGHAAETASKTLGKKLGGHLNINRQKFDKILLNETDNLHSLATQFMEEAQYGEANNILEDVQVRYSVTGGDFNFIMVFGGGSITFKKDLYNRIVKFANMVQCIVIWIPEKYAVNMNIDGLDILHDKVFFPRGAVGAGEA
ncbi:ParM/StbA family protein [Paenibacillus kribbensis]|uniref:ParM/StbA family protein n=1 Tax=Paenibacillus kribbensis TaxID=172713 RepID=UPI002DBFE874|nr:ParM/StbA family protein [Paenibacillus kribbensis]MEC0238189.1 ParM/StbA family protein [Paenibacillus kribbensis]